MRVAVARLPARTVEGRCGTDVLRMRALVGREGGHEVHASAACRVQFVATLRTADCGLREVVAGGGELVRQARRATSASSRARVRKAS
ncbi:hypothetical protein GCM10027515_05390 [Schumannella luteola]